MAWFDETSDGSGIAPTWSSDTGPHLAGMVAAYEYDKGWKFDSLSLDWNLATGKYWDGIDKDLSRNFQRDSGMLTAFYDDSGLITGWVIE